jgi:hypothetical protein
VVGWVGGKATMRFLKFALLLFRRVPLCFLLLYWTAFIGYTVTKLIQGGSWPITKIWSVSTRSFGAN